MNRIALLEKGIEFELQIEIPWHANTATPKYNPLEKLPILIFEDGFSVYDTQHIQEYIVQKYAEREPKLIPQGIDAGLTARQIQALAVGMMDALSLVFFERAREQPSPEWSARQNRKVDNVVKAFSDLVKAAKGSWLVGGEMTIADIAVACAMRGIQQWDFRPRWKAQYPELAAWWEAVESRDSFQQTLPVLFEITEKIV
jgi:glutathione S-transferase